MKMTFIQIAFSLFPPSVSLYACVCSSSNCASVMGPEPSQWKWQVEDTVFAGAFCCSVFHALVDLSLVHWSTYQGTSTDQVKNLNEALFIFLCFCGWGGPWKSQLELVGPNNSHEVWWRTRDCWLSSYWQSSHEERVTRLSAWVPVGHALWFSVSCTAERLHRQMRSVIQWWNT